jgi:hypothetical protein
MLERYGSGRAVEIAKDLRSRYSFGALPVHCGFYGGSIVAWAVENTSFRPFVPGRPPSDAANVFGINEFHRLD